MAQWFSALAAMAMLSARTWVRVPPTTSGVFRLYQGFSTQYSNSNANICAMCLNYLAKGYQGLHVKQAKKRGPVLASGVFFIKWKHLITFITVIFNYSLYLYVYCWKIHAKFTNPLQTIREQMKCLVASSPSSKAWVLLKPLSTTLCTKGYCVEVHWLL